MPNCFSPLHVRFFTIITHTFSVFKAQRQNRYGKKPGIFWCLYLYFFSGFSAFISLKRICRLTLRHVPNVRYLPVKIPIPHKKPGRYAAARHTAHSASFFKRITDDGQAAPQSRKKRRTNFFSPAFSQLIKFIFYLLLPGAAFFRPFCPFRNRVSSYPFVKQTTTGYSPFIAIYLPALNKILLIGGITDRNASYSSLPPALFYTSQAARSIARKSPRRYSDPAPF